jgi:hypothetical protein
MSCVFDAHSEQVKAMQAAVARLGVEAVNG